MVPFAGWSMPIQYKDSIMEATQHCRNHASLFDVAHMCGLTLKVRGDRRAAGRPAQEGGAAAARPPPIAHRGPRLAAAQGKDAISFLEGLVVGDIAGLADGTGSLSCFTNEKGGIIDDTVITKVRRRLRSRCAGAPPTRRRVNCTCAGSAP
jgi:aminomethyltransferase